MRNLRLSRDEDGAAAVEFALLIVPFLVLCFGLISGGIVLNDKMSLTQGVREGARYGATLPYTAGQETTFLTAIRNAAVGDAYGQIDSSTASFCVGFRKASDGTNYRLDSNENTAVQNATCPGAPTLTNGYLVVVAVKPAQFNLVVTQYSLNLASTSVARYEGTS